MPVGIAYRTGAADEDATTRITPPQGDLFRLDSPLYGDIQGERTVAEFPLFALTKRAQMKPMPFASDTAQIEIGERQVKYVEVMLCDWLHRAILTDRRIAAYHDDFLKLGQIERRLYEFAKSNCVDGARYEADAVDLAGRVGCSLEPRLIKSFKQTLREVARNQSLPEYTLALADRKERSLGGGRPKVSALMTITPIDGMQLAGVQAAEVADAA